MNCVKPSLVKIWKFLGHNFKTCNSEEFYLEVNKGNGKELNISIVVIKTHPWFLFVCLFGWLVGGFSCERKEHQTGVRGGKGKQQSCSTGQWGPIFVVWNEIARRMSPCNRVYG